MNDYGINGPAMLCTSWICVICVCKLKDYIIHREIGHGMTWREKYNCCAFIGEAGWHWQIDNFNINSNYCSINTTKLFQTNSCKSHLKAFQDKYKGYVKWTTIQIIM